MKISFVVGLGVGVALTAVCLLNGCGDQGEGSGRAASASKPGAEKPTTGGDVIINGVALAQRGKDEFQQRYGVAPVAGNYWYDAQSGLWGLAGQPAAGFLHPGHDFGAMAANASSGHTSIFLNGREMPQAEVQVFGLLVGPIQPGRYWLDGTGNYGYEGMPMPVGNLYMKAAASGGARGGGGDNFWSSRFARGNYNEDNTMGYVSLPGGGAVTYGM